jgi:type II secretory pathway pseudopilin PulG
MIRQQTCRGFTLVELVISVLIASLMIISIVILVKSYKNMSNDVKVDVVSEGDVVSFIDIFTEDIASSGNQPIDSLISSIYLSGPVIEATYSGATAVSQIKITTDLSTSTRQVVTYKVINLPRFADNPNEKAIVKSKLLTNGTVSEQIYSDELALANVSSFDCTNSINPTPVNANADIRGLNCTLVATGARSVLKTYNFYAKAENQF